MEERSISSRSCPWTTDQNLGQRAVLYMSDAFRTGTVSQYTGQKNLFCSKVLEGEWIPRAIRNFASVG